MWHANSNYIFFVNVDAHGRSNKDGFLCLRAVADRALPCGASERGELMR